MKANLSMLKNLVKLKDDMKVKGWSICSFLFVYKNIRYIVLVKRFVGNEKRKNEYAIVRLHFMKHSNLSDDLEIEANSNSLIVEAKILRNYFNIGYAENIGDILRQFTSYLGRFVPEVMLSNPTNIEKDAMVLSLSKSDSEDPNKIYCCAIRRNPKGCMRTVYNNDKTKILRPKLFSCFKNDKTISFCY